MRKDFLAYNQAYIGEEEIQEVVDTLRSGWLTTGPRTKKLEEKLQEYLSVKHVIALNSCTAGLHLSLVALGIGKGDEVIVPDMTFAATANVVIHTGATPIIVDVTRDTYHIDPEEIRKHITPRTKAIIPVHYGGQACDMDAIMQIAKEHNLHIIEDNAHSLGTKYKGRHLGTIGTTGAFSFYATKNMTTAEGGVVATNDDELAKRIRMLILHGISKDAWKRYSAEGSWYYEVVEPGFKCNLTDLAAALGIHQIDRLPWFIKRRAELAELLNRELASVPGIATPKTLSYNNHSWHLYGIEIDESKTGISRNQFIEEMKARNIGTSVHFIPLHKHPYYRDTFKYTPAQFPVAEAVFERIVSLPLYPKMSDQDARDVVESVKDIVINRST